MMQLLQYGDLCQSVNRARLSRAPLILLELREFMRSLWYWQIVTMSLLGIDFSLSAGVIQIENILLSSAATPIIDTSLTSSLPFGGLLDGTTTGGSEDSNKYCK